MNFFADILVYDGSYICMFMVNGDGGGCYVRCRNVSIETKELQKCLWFYMLNVKVFIIAADYHACRVNVLIFSFVV